MHVNFKFTRCNNERFLKIINSHALRWPIISLPAGVPGNKTWKNYLLLGRGPQDIFCWGGGARRLSTALFDTDLDNVKANQHVKYLCRKWFCSNVVVRTHTPDQLLYPDH